MIRRAPASVLFTLVLLAAPGAARGGGWVNPGLLVGPDEVQANASKPGWVIVDCRDPKAYAKGHIPGAITLGKECKKALRDPTARVFKDPKKYESLLGKAGIGNATDVVFYGEPRITDLDATVAFWVMEYLGHEKAHVLNGGVHAWLKSGRQLTTEASTRPATTFKAKVVPSRYASSEEMLRIATAKTRGATVIDSRSKREHEGEDVRALRGGAIPNTTVNVPHTDTMDQVKDEDSGKDVDSGYLSPDRVASFFQGMDRSKRTIAYCQTGTRSTLTYLELRLLGFKEPANYDDSWTVWGNNLRYPVANEQWINLDRLSKVEKALQKLEEAERARAELASH